MFRTLLPAIFSCLLIIMVGCTDYEALDKAEYDRESQEMLAKATGRGLNLYKGIKMVVRATPVSVEMDSFDAAQMPDAQSKLLANSKLRVLVAKYFGQDVSGSDITEASISVFEWADIIKDVAGFEEEIKGMNEDDFPTMLQTFTTIQYLFDENALHPKELDWNKHHEHLLLAVAVQEVEYLPSSVKVYEMMQCDPSQMDNNGLKPLSHMMKGVLFMDETWNYHAEEQFTKAIDATTTSPVKIENKYYQSLFPGTELASGEGQLTQMQAMGYLLRAYARYGMKAEHKQEQAGEDVEMFLKISDRLAIDNELSWSIAAMHHIYQEDKVNALVYINKMKAAGNMGPEELQALAQVESYLEKRDHKAALNVFYDKLIVGDVALGYMHSYLRNIEWYNKMLETEGGKDLLGFPDQMDGLYSKIKTMMELKDKANATIDDLKGKGEELLKYFDSE